MKSKLYLIGFFALLFCSCNTIKYLPSREEIDINQYGSYIRISHIDKKFTIGELIAVDSSQLIVLPKNANFCTAVPRDQVKSYSVRYAKPKEYLKSIPLLLLLTLSHGNYLIVSLPINLFTTLAVLVSAEKEFEYTHKTITFDQLAMFARFPQGLPEGIDVSSINSDNAKPVKP